LREEAGMKLYYHPVSTTSRPVALFATESDIKLDYQVVDLFTGEQYQPEYAAINPSHQVPVLGGEVIDCKFGAYPNICRWLGNMKALKSWAKVNEAFYKYVVDPNKGKEFVRV
jgi:hypothetical protein